MTAEQQQRIEELEYELERTRKELAERELQIAYMELSKFWKLRNLWWRLKEGLRDPAKLLLKRRPLLLSESSPPFVPGPVPPREPQPLAKRTKTADIVICVHNALDDVKRCLESVLARTSPPFQLILVDDGSEAPARDFLIEIQKRTGALRIRNEKALGYTFAANQGLRVSEAPLTVLLNSDTIVTSGWLDRMAACIEENPRAGITSPLSNCASWQSIPEVASSGGDWADNPLPPGMTPDHIAALLAQDAGPLHPRVPFLNGFCLLIRRELMDEIGVFDEKTFGKGYGEENDYCIRARKAGWDLVIADDVYVHHAQSRSYSTEKRRALSDAAGIALASKHGQNLVDEGVAVLRTGRVLEGLRERARERVRRFQLIEEGRKRFLGKRVLFVLPVQERGGGANVVFSEARAMQRMGVDVSVFNLTEFRSGFSAAYSEYGIPLVFGSRTEIPDAARAFDAVIATANTTVGWLVPLANQSQPPVIGYYIQDYEPHFYPEGSAGFEEAFASYTRIPGMVTFTKTEWNRAEVEVHTGVSPRVIGGSLDTSLYRPFRPAPPEVPVRISAMIRPSSPRRGPSLTMQVFSEIASRYGKRVEFFLYGVDPADPAFLRLERGFPFQHIGLADGSVLADVFNQTHIFADFSTYQAMGLSAMEAMACGATAIVPQKGGASIFARHDQNSLIIDTQSRAACRDALASLIEDPARTKRLADTAHRDLCRFSPERPAFKILDALFPGSNTGHG